MGNAEPTRRRREWSGYSGWPFDSILQKKRGRDVFKGVGPAGGRT